MGTMENQSESEFSTLMARVQNGCQQAARELVLRYGGVIRKVVRRRLDQRMRLEYDSLDFLQDVWSSFFRTTRDCRFEKPDDLVNFLVNMACNKVCDAQRHRLGPAGALSHEQPLPQPTEDDHGNDLPVRRQPTPSQVAVANEQWENLLRGLPPEYQHMLELLRQGYTHEEIAKHFGTYTKVIQRLLERLERKSDLQRKGAGR
jgi:RNA polymerase sigma-70 factor (ECF subfamily)